MKSNWKKLLSMLLVLTMLLGLMPAVFAAEDEDPAEPEQIEELLTDEPVDPEVPETPEEPETPDAPADPEDPEVPEEPADPEVPEEPAEEPEEEEDLEEEDAAELPYGFPGMGEDYELSEAELAAKLAIAELPEALAAMTPGVDYVEGELLLMTDSEDYALLVAEAYDAELLAFTGSYARLQLRGATVLQAVECAADPAIPLPAVEPNFIAANIAVSASAGDFDAQGERMSWDDWEWDTDANPWLDPLSANYQYHHDILQDYAAWGVTNGFGANVVVISLDRADVLAALIGDGIDDGEGVGVAYEASVSTVSPAGDTAPDFAASIDAAAAGSIILVDAAFPGLNTVLSNAVLAAQNKGSLVIAPMGDNGSNRMCWPAACTGVISVAATDAAGSLAGFSNFGAWCVISAPGSALNGVSDNSGTSYAAALVAGAAALYAGRFQNLSGFAAAVKKAVVKGGAGAGVLNTAKLFGGAPEKPTATAGAAVYSVKGSVHSMSEDGWFKLSIPEGLSDDLNPTIYYTLNGSKPAMKNGLIANAAMAEPDAEGKVYIADTPNLKLGKTYTLKAIATNGLGVSSKIASWKFKLVGTNEDITVSILNAPERVVAGKSVTLTAQAVNGDGNAVNQKFTWSIASQSDGLGASINKTSGKLTTKANRAGMVTVLCKHNDSGAEATCTLTIAVVQPVAKAVLNGGAKTETLWTGDAPKAITLTLTAKDGSTVAAADAGVRWTSSNEKVVIVVEDGDAFYLDPVAAGTATVKAAVLDGSGKSASIKVTVKQKADTILVSTKNNATVLAPGCTINLVATVLPADATDKSVVWTFDNIGSYGTMLTANNEKGTLKLNSNFVPHYDPSHPENNLFITARASLRSDNTVVSEDFVIPVRPKASAVSVKKVEDPLWYDAVWNESNGNLKTLTLLGRDMPNEIEEAPDEQLCSLFLIERYGVVSQPSEDMITASVKNTAIAEIVGYEPDTGRLSLLAKKPGNTTVTIQSGDATKKLTFSLKVLNPMSAVIIESAAPGKTNAVAAGKSIKLKGVALDTYGKPTNTKLSWEIVEVYAKGGEKLYDAHPATYVDKLGITKFVTVNQSGVVKVSKTSAYQRIERIIVKAEPANYPKALTAEYTVYAADPISSLVFDPAAKGLTLTSAAPEATVSFTATDVYGAINRDADVEHLFSVTSSKPALVGAVLVCADDYSSCSVQLSVPDPSKLTAKAQSVKITLKANDGSGKTATFTVKVTQ